MNILKLHIVFKIKEINLNVVVYISKLMPKIHFVNSDEYNRKNGKLENKMRLLKTTVFPDDVKNPLLINFDMENCKKANMQERCKAIINEENQFFSENEDEIQRFKKN